MFCFSFSPIENTILSPSAVSNASVVPSPSKSNKSPNNPIKMLLSVVVLLIYLGACPIIRTASCKIE